MSLRGAAAIVGIYDIKPARSRPDRDIPSLLAEACFGAIRDAGLRKEDIDGMLMEPEFGGSASGLNAKMAEYMGIQPKFAGGINVEGSSGTTGAVLAAAIVNAGLANYVLVACAGTRDPNVTPTFPPPDPFVSEWEIPFGPGAAPGGYAFIAQRYEALYGGTVEKRAKISVDQRANAVVNPDALFFGKPITAQDVIDSRMIASPLRLLECVIPACGGTAYIVGRADLAKAGPNRPVYILGGASHVPRKNFLHMSDFLTPPVERAARRTFAMAGYGPQDMDVLELYDSFTITVILELEGSGFSKPGEGADWIQDQDFTVNGNLPLNTHGGQMSFGQSGDAGGFTQVTEGARQLRGTAGTHQAKKDVNLVLVTGSGGIFSEQSAMVLTNDPTA